MTSGPARTDRWDALDFGPPPSGEDEPDESVLVEHVSDGRVAVITLNRPHADNAITTEMGTRLTQILETIAVTVSVRVAILTGAGQRSFSVGSDLRQRNDMTKEQWLRQRQDFDRTLYPLRQLRKPIIAAVNSGLRTAGARDRPEHGFLHRSPENANVSVGPRAMLGLAAGGGSPVLLPQLLLRLAGPLQMADDRAADHRSSKPTGSAHGQLDHPQTELMDAALRIADKIASNSPTAVQAVKRAVRLGEGQPIEQAIAIMMEATWRSAAATRIASRASAPSTTAETPRSRMPTTDDRHRQASAPEDRDSGDMTPQRTMLAQRCVSGLDRGREEKEMTHVLVIGAGPAGVFAAYRAAGLGAETTLVTRDEFGGMAANDGPVPVRTLAHAARLIRDARQLGEHGIGRSVNSCSHYYPAASRSPGFCGAGDVEPTAPLGAGPRSSPGGDPRRAGGAFRRSPQVEACGGLAGCTPTEIILLPASFPASASQIPVRVSATHGDACVPDQATAVDGGAGCGERRSAGTDLPRFRCRGPALRGRPKDPPRLDDEDMSSSALRRPFASRASSYVRTSVSSKLSRGRRAAYGWCSPRTAHATPRWRLPSWSWLWGWVG